MTIRRSSDELLISNKFSIGPVLNLLKQVSTIITRFSTKNNKINMKRTKIDYRWTETKRKPQPTEVQSKEKKKKNLKILEEDYR